MILHNTTQEYISDPETRVFISYNDESGEWLYSVVAANSKGFWLDSFETNEEALEYIVNHNLKMV